MNKRLASHKKSWNQFMTAAQLRKAIAKTVIAELRNALEMDIATPSPLGKYLKRAKRSK